MPAWKLPPLGGLNDHSQHTRRTPASGPLHLLFLLPGVLFSQMSARLPPSRPSSLYVRFSRRTSGNPHPWHILFYFSHLLPPTDTLYMLLIVYQTCCLSFPPAPLECKLHKGLEECLAHICWMNKWIMNERGNSKESSRMTKEERRTWDHAHLA